MPSHKARLAYLKSIVEANRSTPIRHVDAVMFAEMIADGTSPRLFRRKRAEALCSAVAYQSIALETGRDHSLAIRRHLERAAEWRKREHETNAPRALSRAA